MTPNELYQKVFTEGKIIQVIPILYADLVSLVNNNQLIPGESYRIIDFVSKYVGTSDGGATFTSAEHPFDIIATAISGNRLSENCSAILSANDNGYFAGQGITSWKIKYTLVPAPIIFEDNYPTTGGKGYIYWMEDEKGNSAPYDFKNLLIDGKYTFHWTKHPTGGSDIEYDASMFSQVRNNEIPYIKSIDVQGIESGKWHLNAVCLHSITDEVINHPIIYANYIQGTEVFITASSIYRNTVVTDCVKIISTTDDITEHVFDNRIYCKYFNASITMSTISDCTIDGAFYQRTAPALAINGDLVRMTMHVLPNAMDGTLNVNTFPNLIQGCCSDAELFISNTPIEKWMSATKVNIYTAAWDSGQSTYAWTNKSITL